MNAYFKAMRQAGFNNRSPVYMASGLLTYGDDKGGFNPTSSKP